MSPEVGDYMLTHKLRYLVELQEKHHFIIEFISKPGLAQEDFAYNVLERKKPEETDQEDKPREIDQSARNEGVKSEQTSEDGTEAKKESGRGRPRNQRAKSGSRRRYTRGRNRPEETKQSTDQVDTPAAQEVTPMDQVDTPAVQAITPTDQADAAESTPIAGISESAMDSKKEDVEASPGNQRAKPAPRKRYTRRKTSTNRSSSYRGRKRRVEKPVSPSNETASPGGDQAKPEADGNVAEPPPVAQEEGSENVSPSVPIASPTVPSDLNPVKESSPQSFPEDPPF